jgi:hypothetical protein
MINFIIQEELYDRAFVEKWCHGFEQLKERAKEYTLEKVANRQIITYRMHELDLDKQVPPNLGEILVYLGEEVTRGLRESASRGYYVCANIPFGYKQIKVKDGLKAAPVYAPDQYTLVLPPEQAQMLLSHPTELDHLASDIQLAATRSGMKLAAKPILRVVADPTEKRLNIKQLTANLDRAIR